MTIFDQTLGLAILLLAGYLGGRLVKLVKMPMVAGYVLAGLFLGPSVFKIIPYELNTAFDLIKILGLGLIALMIGRELEIKKIKHLGKTIMGTTIVQILGASIVVFVAMYFILGLSLEISLLLGAMATATAPASPVAVIREYKAKGPFTTTLLGVVAMDDAVCIILFGVVAAIVRTMLDGTFTVGYQMLLLPTIEFFGSFGLGIAIGLIMVFILQFIEDRQHKIALIVALNLGVGNEEVHTVQEYQSITELVNVTEMAVKIVELL